MTAVVSLASRRAPAPPASAPAPAPLAIAPTDRILRLRDVRDRVGLSRATIYRRIKRAEFPASLSLGGITVGWRESDINTWIAARGTGGAQ
jgi:prophage regulatory protein